MSIYNYSISTDTLNGLVDCASFQREIALSTITIALVGCTVRGNNLDVEFKTALSTSEETELTTLLSNHTGESSIEEVVQKVKVLEEDGDTNKQTGGHFRAKTLAYDIPTGTQWHYTNFTFPYPICILSMEYVGVSTHEGDLIKIDIAPDTTIGEITSDVSISDTVINVDNNVLANIKVGYLVTLDDGTNSESLGYVVDLSKKDKTITVENAATIAFSASTPTSIKQTIPIIDGIEIDYTTSSIAIGATKIGGSYLPANTVLRFGYFNGDATAGKRFRAILEFLY